MQTNSTRQLKHHTALIAKPVIAKPTRVARIYVNTGSPLIVCKHRRRKPIVTFRSEPHSWAPQAVVHQDFVEQKKHTQNNTRGGHRNVTCGHPWWERSRAGGRDVDTLRQDGLLCVSVSLLALSNVPAMKRFSNVCTEYGGICGICLRVCAPCFLRYEYLPGICTVHQLSYYRGCL